MHVTTTADDLLQTWTTCLQALRLWMMQLVVWLAAVSGSREMRLMAQEDLRQLRREVRLLLVTRMAIALQAGTFAPPQYRKIRITPAIDLSLSHRRFNRCALRGIRLRTFADAKRVLDNIDAYVARVARNLRNGVAARGRYWKARAPAVLCSITHATDAPDTS